VKITDIRVVIHEREHQLKSGFGGHPGTSPMGILRILTDEGIEGNAFVFGSAPGAESVSAAIVQFIKPRLLGQDPLLISKHWHDMVGMTRASGLPAVGFVDIALWDIAGKAAGMPIHRMLGTYRESMVAYLSAWPHPTTADYVEEIQHYLPLGWKGYKMHPQTQFRKTGKEVPIEEDIEMALAVRDAVGPDVFLMMDSAGAYTWNEAIKVGRALESADYLWYEDPLPYADDVYGYSKLREKLDIPIVATEATEGGLYALPAWIQARATDALRGDPAIKGGITGMMKIAALAEAYHLNCEIHESYNALTNVATLHLAMAIKNMHSYEILTINPLGEYGLQHFNYGLIDPIEVDREGLVHAPTKPGLGHDIDWELLNSRVKAVLA